MTSSRFVPIPEQVAALKIEQGRQRRELVIVREDAKRSASQAEGAIEDVRTLTDLYRRMSARLDVTDAAVQRIGANVLVVAGHQGEQLVVMARMAEALERLEPSVESAKRKASAANHRAVKLEARQSLTEEQVRQALDDVAATSRAIVANPPEGDELKALQREVLKGAKPLAGKLGLALMGLLIAACVYGAAAFTSCSPGGF